MVVAGRLVAAVDDRPPLFLGVEVSCPMAGRTGGCPCGGWGGGLGCVGACVAAVSFLVLGLGAQRYLKNIHFSNFEEIVN